MTKKAGFLSIHILIVVAIIGILAAVAIPAFLKYTKRKKTTEKLQNLRRVYDSSVSNFDADHNSEDGEMTSSFPTLSKSEAESILMDEGSAKSEEIDSVDVTVESDGVKTYKDDIPKKPIEIVEASEDPVRGPDNVEETVRRRERIERIREERERSDRTKSSSPARDR